MVLPLKYVGFTLCEVCRSVFKSVQSKFNTLWIRDQASGWTCWCSWEDKKREGEIFNRHREPSSRLQAFWSGDEVQVVSVFDTTDEKWGRIRCNSGLLQHCTQCEREQSHTDPLPSKIYTVQTLLFSHSIMLNYSGHSNPSYQSWVQLFPYSHSYHHT